MDLQQAPTYTIGNEERQSAGVPRFHGRWLVLARMVWIIIFLLTLVVFCANLIDSNYGLITTILLVAVTSVWFSVGGVLFWRKSTDRYILLISLGLILLRGVFFPPHPDALLHKGLWVFPIDFLEFLAWASLSLLYTFPDGRFVPGFTRWYALGWIAVSLAANVPTFLLFGFGQWFWAYIFYMVLLLFVCSLALAQVYRYLWVLTPVQRQQTKWVFFAFAIVIVVGGLMGLYLFVALNNETQFEQFVFAIALYYLPVLIPLSIGIALLRYRLWDIDVIIRRTLVYSTLTVILALLYVGLVIGLESLVRLFTGQVSQSPVIIVASTLAIAALFQPLRHWIQRIIDRRFYRSKYDAARTLAAFSTALRQEVDLDQLQGHLLAVVQETMQPTHVSLWLRPPESDGKQRAPWSATPPVSSEGR